VIKPFLTPPAAPFNTVATAVQPVVDPVAPPVQAVVDAIAAALQVPGRPLMAVGLCPVGAAVEAVLNPVTAIVQALIDTVAAFVQPLIHAAVVGHRPGTQQQTATQNARFQNYGFHDAPRFCVFVTAVNACPQTGLTLIRAILQKPDAVHK
jgi:hypothetical protein